MKNELDAVSAGLRDAGSKKKACDECVRLRADNTAAREACEEMKSEVLNPKPITLNPKP